MDSECQCVMVTNGLRWSAIVHDWVYLGYSWPSRSSDLNPCDFWLWGYLKDVVLSTPIAHSAELKARIAQHILNVTPETLLSVVEHAVSRLQLVAENGGQHIEHILHQSREI
ncbi:hypothetical protein AVEN_96029-1 [Araneus ventricosus]|uniref:Tc1-like transposase DDE domain-containing protein n=1 Tax=Araneus ventricosus TaxID=182803 RepID=A0A4Y2B363_ARAVE|nr:hypothetical protein AVEN_96029-1 [Araneus ventricosus]